MSDDLSSAKRFVVVVDGAGEYRSDFSVLVMDAESSSAAMERVTGMGYGQDRDGVAYVAEFGNVEVFRINDSTTKVSTPTTFDEVLADTPPNLRQYIDVDGGHDDALGA